MALSLEEIDVLESARVNDGGYPLFINGRAGSGKSTILQYLFSEYLYHHLNKEDSTPGPVFFACNDELLARCSHSVRSLLKVRQGRRDSSHGSGSSTPLSGVRFAIFIHGFTPWCHASVF